MGEKLPLRCSESLSEWMTNLPAEIARQPLNLLAIPGSHDSFTSAITHYSVPSPDGDAYKLVRHLPQCIAGRVLPPWTITQAFSLAKQLQMGIRYLDLRVAVRPGKSASQQFYLVHGQYVCPIVDDLRAVADFLRSHPREVVLLDCNHCYDFATQQEVVTFEETVCGVVGSFLCPWNATVPTLEEIWKNGKQILFFSCLRSVGTKDFWPGWQISSLWPNTIYVDKMIQYLDEHYGPTYVRSPDKFYVFQGVLTPTAGYIVCHPFGSVRRLARIANKAFVQWIQAEKRVAGIHGLNITLMDYVGVDSPDYVQNVVQLNYKTWVCRPPLLSQRINVCDTPKLPSPV
ncbi:PI-PLC X domain-containing protein 3 [Clonorchis sinensis]|uniref:PI-PLC X domain-containing protein 3 n=1 Tax=Clonorchis sinensis TaxID=79923 RepID=G7YNF5_CLOSI|nr:PI-PLC X domain-containing protein 3 [Clonorchis sinensis]